MAILSVGGLLEKQNSGSVEGAAVESVGRHNSRSSEIDRLSDGSTACVPSVSVRHHVSS